MLKYVYKEDSDNTLTLLDQQLEHKPTELPLIQPDNNETWLDFLSDEKPIHIDEMLIQQNIDTDHSVDQSIDQSFNQSELQSGKIMTPDLLKEVVDSKLPKEIKNVSPKKKIIKYIEPKSGKVYYFEMDKTLDLSKVQEIIINPNEDSKTPEKKTIEKTKNNGVLTSKLNPNSLLKPNFETKTNKQSVQFTNQSVKKTVNQSQRVFEPIVNHIENDHCYLGPCFKVKSEHSNIDLNEIRHGTELFEKLVSNVKRLNTVRVAVNFLLKNIPLVSVNSTENDYVKLFPFTVKSVEHFWSLDVAKRRNIEVCKHKHVNFVQEKNIHK